MQDGSCTPNSPVRAAAAASCLCCRAAYLPPLPLLLLPGEHLLHVSAQFSAAHPAARTNLFVSNTCTGASACVALHECCKHCLFAFPTSLLQPHQHSYNTACLQCFACRTSHKHTQTRCDIWRHIHQPRRLHGNIQADNIRHCCFCGFAGNILDTEQVVSTTQVRLHPPPHHHHPPTPPPLTTTIPSPPLRTLPAGSVSARSQTLNPKPYPTNTWA